MKYLIAIVLFTFLCCESQVKKSEGKTLNFETVNQFSYPIIKGNFQVLNSQEKIDAVYKIIHSKTEGNRLAPIPTYSEDETYFVFKPASKSINEIEISEILLQGKTLNISFKENTISTHPNDMVSPYILVKIPEKIVAEKINTKTIK